MTVEEDEMDTLRGELLRMLSNLNSGAITHQEAIAGSMLAAQISESLRTEMKYSQRSYDQWKKSVKNERHHLSE